MYNCIKVLALENKVMELQMYLDKTELDLKAAREEMNITASEHKELADEYIALKTSHIQLTGEHQNQVQKLMQHAL